MKLAIEEQRPARDRHLGVRLGTPNEAALDDNERLWLVDRKSVRESGRSMTRSRRVERPIGSSA